MKGAQKQNDFVETGHEIVINLVKSLDNDDQGGLLECIEDIPEITEKLLLSHLTAEQAEKLKELKNA